jgi:hypothetical protein
MTLQTSAGDDEVKLSSGFDETPKHSQKLKMNSPGIFLPAAPAYEEIISSN